MKICEKCNGQGRVYWTDIHYVTRDMAIDAGEPSMEGMPMEEQRDEECPDCNGSGYTE